MSVNNYEYLYDNIEKIKDLSYQVPKKFQDSVFEALFTSLINGSEANSYKNQIESLAFQKGVNIRECIEVDKLKSYVDKTIAFVYYLQLILKISSVSQEHIVECYSNCFNENVSNLSQNLRDLSGKYNYLKFDNGYKLSDFGYERCIRKGLINPNYIDS